MANIQGIAALVLSAISLLLCIVGTAIPYWNYYSVGEIWRSQGLWQICIGGPERKNCGDFTGSVPDWIQATRAMEILGILLIASAVICGCLKLFVLKTQDLLPKVAAGTGIAAGLFMLVGAIVYGAKFADIFEGISPNLHAGFGLAIVAAIGSIVSGILYILAGNNGQI